MNIDDSGKIYWLKQWNENPKDFIYVSLVLCGKNNLMEEIDLYLNNPLERIKARQYIQDTEH